MLEFFKSNRVEFVLDLIIALPFVVLILSVLYSLLN